MKKFEKNIIWAFGIIFACILILGKGMTVSAEQAIVPVAGNGNTYQYQMAAGMGILSVPVQISQAGAVYFEITAQTDAEMFSAVLSDSAAASDSSGWLAYSVDKKITLSSYAKGACAWYLHFATQASDIDKDVSISVRAYQDAAKAGNGTLKKGKWTSVYIEDEGSVYYKITVPSSGCLTLEMSSDNESALLESTLLNNKKKKISKDSYSLKETHYGVKKGTYYMKVDNGSAKGAVCKIRYTFEKISVNKNTTQSKAVNLKKGKKGKGIFLRGEKKSARWYKVKLNKNKTIRWTISVKANYSAGDFSIYEGPYKAIKTKILENGKNTWKLKLKKGTYYFVMNIFNSGGEGSYSVQWK